MTVVGEAVVIVRPLTAGFAEKVLADTDKAMTAAGQKAGTSFGKSLTSVIPGANGLQKGIVGIVATTAALAVASIDMANKYNKNLLLIQTQAGASRKEVDYMRGAILNLAPAVATGPAALAEALYHIESVGYRGAAALDVLKISAEGAKIGQANLDDTTYALTSTLMTGIGGIHDATSAMAALDAIVGTGDMRMQGLNAAISTGFLATAETFGVSIQSVGAALAYLTDRGASADEAATRLKMSITLLGAPAARASTILGAIGLSGAEVTARTGAMTMALAKAHVTTTQLADDMRKPDGIQVALTDLVTHLRDSGVSADAAAAIISRAFGGGRSGAAIMSMIQHLDVLKTKFDTQVQIAGTFGDRWKATTESTSFRWSQFVTLVQTDAIKVGEALIPMTNQLGSGLFNALSGAPALLTPLGHGLRDVGVSIGEVLHQLAPVGRVLLTAFGGAALVSIDTAGIALRDVVAPAIHIVADGLHLLVGTTPGITILATVLTIKLLPVLIEMAATLAAWTFEQFINGAIMATAAAQDFGTAIETLNPALLAVGVVVGGAIAIYENYAGAKDRATKATNDLVTALGKEAAGQQNSILVALDKQLNDLHVGDDIQRLGLDINKVSQAVLSGGPALDQLGAALNRLWEPHVGDSFSKNMQAVNSVISEIRNNPNTSPGLISLIDQFGTLTNSSKLSASQLKNNQREILAVLDAVSGLHGTMNAANSQYASMVLNQQILNHAMSDGVKPVDALATAQHDAALAGKALSAANQVIDASTFQSTQALAKQVDLLKDYSKQATVTGQDIQNTIIANTKMLANEGNNINRLASQGVDTGFIQALKDQGPQYVAAAASLGDQGLAALNQSWLAGQTQLQHTGAAIGRALAPAAVAAGAAALSAQQGAMRVAAQITFFNTVQGALQNVVSIAGEQGGNIGNRFGDGLTRSKQAVLTASLNALPAPVRAAVLQALGIATTAGGQLPHNLADAINQNAPAATGAAEAMRAAVQARIDMLHGKTLEVKADDQASGALNTINSDITTLEGLNNTLKAMRYATGGFVPYGAGTRGADSVHALVMPGEYVTREAVVASEGVGAFHALNEGRATIMPRFADGGLVSTWPILMGRYAQSLAAGIDPSKMTGTGISGNVASWLPTVLMALALNGAPASYAPRVLTQIQFESGGNPNAHQQVIDINTFNGSGGAQGILQVLLDTFLANHVPGTSMNIFDPLANIAAGIHHAIHDDPGGLDYLGQGHGYDAGGPVRPGRTLVINNTGGDEWIENGPQHSARVQNGRPTPKVDQTNHFYGVDLDEALTEAGSRLMHTLTTTMR